MSEPTCRVAGHDWADEADPTFDRDRDPATCARCGSVRTPLGDGGFRFSYPTVLPEYRVVAADPERRRALSADANDIDSALEAAWRLLRHHGNDTVVVRVRDDVEVATVSVTWHEGI